jgi:2-polyprenyl-6-methoxyphenol hydroxylase-like FAD-dependent oxidoreductase
VARDRCPHHFTQNETGVVAPVCDLATGSEFSVASAYLVGCDGGRSVVRKKIGARLNGTSVIQRVQSTYIRAPELLPLVANGPAWISHSLNPWRCRTVFAIDGRETWLVHNHLYDAASENLHTTSRSDRNELHR